MSDKERLSVLREKKESLLLEAEFLINSIKETNQTSELFSEFKSIKGFREDLASLITPLRPEFDLPLRIALGPALNYLVVDTTEDAKLMNVILREKGIQKDVLILENIKNKNSKINDSLIGNYGVVAEHSISYRRDIMNLDKALSYLLNGKVLCDNMKNAENIKNLFNKKKIENPKEIITYDGIVFRKGTVSCLGDKKKEGKKFGRNVNNFEVEIRKEKEKEIEKIRQEILKNEIELKKIKENNNENEIKKMELKIQENISKKQIFIEEIEGLDDSRKKNEKVLKLLSDQNKKFNNETIKLEKQLETVNKDIEKTNENINNEEGIIYKALCKKLNVSNISEFKSKDYEEIEKINERLIILKKQLENIQNQIKKYNKNNGNDILNSLSKSISDEKNNLASQKENFKKYEDLSNKLNKEIDNIILELNEKNNDISKEQTEELDAFSFLKELETNLTTKV